MPDRPIPPAAKRAMDAVTTASDKLAAESTTVQPRSSVAPMKAPGPFADLPGVSLEVRRDPSFFAPDQAVVRVEQRMPASNPPDRSKLTGVIPISEELLNDSGVPLTQLIEAQMDRTFRPWRYPDPNPFPPMDRLVAPITTKVVTSRPCRWAIRRRLIRRYHRAVARNPRPEVLR